MLRLSLLGALSLLLAAAAARPQSWAGSDDGQAAGSVPRGAFTGQFVAPEFERGGFRPLRQGRRIAADTATNSVAGTTTTPKSTTEKKLVTLRPIGDNIQEILYNNGYRDSPGEKEPEPNNIDDYGNLDGISPDEVWLLDDNLLVLKGGELTEGFIDAEPIDDYQAPYREPKFPPPGFNPDGILPPGTFGTTFGGGQRQPEAFIPEFGYDPYGLGGRTAPGARRVLPPTGFQYPTARPAAAQPDLPRHTHQQVTYVKKAARFPETAPLQRPAGFINNFDGLPRSYSTGSSYPAAAATTSGGQPRTAGFQPAAPTAGTQTATAYSGPATTLYGRNGNYMTYTNHDGGFSYSYKTDGQTGL